MKSPPLTLRLILLSAALIVALDMKMREVVVSIFADENKMAHSSRIGNATSLGATIKSLDQHATDNNASKEKGTDYNDATDKVNATNTQRHTTVPRSSSAAEFKPNNSYWNNVSRPLLIFKHYPKAGGGSIKTLLKEFKSIKEFEGKASLRNITDPDKTFMSIKEFKTLYPIHRKKGFVISSMREPCNQYLSLWAYGSEEKGYMYNDLKARRHNWTVTAYGQDPPLFNSQRDIEAFRNIWLKDPEIKGLLAKRFHNSYGFSDIKSVDCWVFVDDFQGSLFSCLKQFEDQGGWVDWNAPLLSELVDNVQERAKQRKLTAYNKNDPVGNPQLSHHSKCLDYFDDETAQYVENGRESFFYKNFGYKGCCHGRQ